MKNPEQIEYVQGKLAFRRLDPTLYLLLLSIRSYKKAQISTSEAGYDFARTGAEWSIGWAGSKSETGELSIRFLKAQVQLMATLQVQILDLNSKYNELEWIIISDSIAFPLLDILSSYRGNEVSNAAHHSARLQAIETAAKALSAFVSILDTPLLSKKTYDYIVVCTSSIPNGVATDGSFERGIDCEKALLQLIRTLLANSTMNGPMNVELTMILNESQLVGQIAASCIAAITVDDHERHKDIALQNEALLTINALLVSVSLKEMWQKLFPGCFVGLCRLAFSHMRWKNSSAEVVSQGLFTMSKLFDVALRSDTLQIKNDRSATSVIQTINTSANNTSEQGTNSAECVCFVDEIDSRLPSVLPMLLNSLHSSSSPKLRFAATELCQRLLTCVCVVLKEENQLAMERCAFESCMILTKDNDEKVANSALAVLQEYKNLIGDTSWRVYYSQDISSRIVEMTVKASTLAKSEREAEFTATLKLIAANLESLSALGQYSWGTQSMNAIQRELRDIFDIDFDLAHLSSIVNSSTTLEQSFIVYNSNAVEFRFRYIGGTSLAQAKGLIRAFTLAFGTKRSHQFVDAAIADLFESCSRRSKESSSSLFGTSQVLWLREWIGTAFVVNEMLECLTTVHPQSEQSARKRLRALSSAIVPILTTAPLWTLPTKVESCHSSNAPSKVSALALKGNAVLVCLLARIVGTLIRKIGNDSRSLLSVALFPLIEKTSSSNHWLVKHEVLRILNETASVFCVSLTLLVDENFDYIFAALLAELRPLAGNVHKEENVRAFCDLSDLIIANLHILYMKPNNKNIVHDSLPSEGRTIGKKTHVSNLIEVVRLLTFRFDLSTRMNLPATDRQVMLLGLLGVYSASISFIKSTLSTEFQFRLANRTETVCHVGSVDQWLEVLEPFRIKTIGSRMCENGSNCTMGTAEPPANSIDFSKEEVDFLSLILERCGFSLSSPNLKIKVASVATQAEAFGLLGLVSAHHNENTEDDGVNQSPHNAVFRQINDSWPSLIAALAVHKFVSAPSRGVPSINLTMEQSSNVMTQSSHYFLLSLIFDLITSMCEASGDFIVGRLKEDVWPTLPKLLGMFLGREAEVKSVLPNVECDSSSPVDPLVEINLTEKDKLLLAILRFLCKCFQLPKIGLGLAGSIESTGAIILPFLGLSNPVGAYTFDVLKAMLQVDSDALRRALYSTARQAFPRCPMKLSSVTVCSNLKTVFCSSSGLEGKAIQLIEFADSLLEQRLG